MKRMIYGDPRGVTTPRDSASKLLYPQMRASSGLEYIDPTTSESNSERLGGILEFSGPRSRLLGQDQGNHTRYTFSLCQLRYSRAGRSAGLTGNRMCPPCSG